MNAVVSPYLIIKKGWLNLRTGFVHILCVGCLVEDWAFCYACNPGVPLKRL